MIAVRTKIEHWELIEPFATARESHGRSVSSRND
jgi:hypothetical protein